MKKVEVSVLIPTLNTKKFLIQCIKYLQKSTKIPLEIIVLDLGNDGTYKWCRKNKIRVFKKYLPSYFAQSCNFLARKATKDFLLFLNPDTIPQESFLDKMIQRFNSPAVVVVGCKLLYPRFSEQNGNIQHAGVEWKSEYPTPDHLPEHIGYLENSSFYWEDYEAKAVTGSCMLVSRECFNKVGGF